MNHPHTPGTWFLARDGIEVQFGDPPQHEVIACVDGKASITIAYLPIAAGSEEDGDPASRVEVSEAESLANGCLFAAAARMFAALREVQEEAAGKGRPYSADSYLPAHILAAVKRALEAASPPTQSSVPAQMPITCGLDDGSRWNKAIPAQPAWLPAVDWQRLNELEASNNAGMMTDADRAEYQAIAERVQRAPPPGDS